MDNSDDGDRILPPPPPPSSYSDELSSFLHQILSRSSPITQLSSSLPDTSIRMQQQQQPPKRIVSAGEMFDRRSFTSVSGDAVAEVGEDNKYAFENKMKARQKNSSKRNIDAQFHNLSEKRRRSKINEKMKALQKLIPNSNKTDKASMLEEAIEYLKQLQLQVQTLAVMNGLGLNPMRLPTVRVNHTTTTIEQQQQDLNLETLLHHGSQAM